MSKIFVVEVRELGSSAREPMRFRCEDVEVENEVRRVDGPDDEWESWALTGNVTLRLRRETK